MTDRDANETRYERQPSTPERRAILYLIADDLIAQGLEIFSADIIAGADVDPVACMLAANAIASLIIAGAVIDADNADATS